MILNLIKMYLFTVKKISNEGKKSINCYENSGILSKSTRVQNLPDRIL